MRKIQYGTIHLRDVITSPVAQSPIRSGFFQRMTGTALLAMAASFFVFTALAHAQNTTPDNGGSVVTPPQPQSPSQSSVQAQPNAGGPTPLAIRTVRLSDVEGDVEILRGNQTVFSHAVMNMPIIQGSRINTGTDGRAEIEFEDGSVTRITPNSSLNIDKLETTADGTLKTTIDQLSGLIYYELRSDPSTPYKVLFQNRTVQPAVNSTFRIDMTANPANLAVIDGGVNVHGSANDYLADVKQGQTIQFQPSGSTKYTLADGIIPNGFDQWNDQRDEEAAKEAENQTPARTQQGGGGAPMGSLLGYGWGDLDAYGGWYPLPGYGMVWQPGGMGPGFDPYGYGGWANMGMGMGYSWVSGYPWGWLPFHYGMWSYIGGFGWGWMPGAYGFGGLGYGYGGGYGYGYGGGGYYPYTNVYGGPAGYRAPAPPRNFQTGVKGGQPSRSFVPVGHPPASMLNAANRTGVVGHGAVFTPHSITFNGTKIAPLRSDMAGVHVPVRNAALYNNYPTHAFPGGVRSAILSRNAGIGGVRSTGMRGTGGVQSRTGGSVGTMRGPYSGARGGAFTVARNGSFNGHAFGTMNRGAFGQHTSFGSRGSFGGAHSSFHSAGGSFHGGSMGGGGGGFHGGGGGGGHGGGGGGGHGGGH